MTSQLGPLLLESIKEVFDWLRPGPQSSVRHLKTNKQYRVPRKVILPYGVDARFSAGFQLRHSIEGNLRSLGNVLSLLDGQGVQHYPHDLYTQLRDDFRSARPGLLIFTPYLFAKGFKNGNLHLEFRRQDLLDRLNALGGDTRLPDQER